MKRGLLYPLLTSLLLSTVACHPVGLPSDRVVAYAFQADHPGSDVVSVTVGEGDSASAYFHIVFRSPNEDGTHEAVWLYQRDTDGEWRVTRKETVR